MSAIFSPCGKYRYTLHRKLTSFYTGIHKPALFIMLNPSTADAVIDDPTIRRCVDFALREECTELTVVNLFGLRSPNPKDLKASPDPVGPENDAYISREINRLNWGPLGLVVAAWGSHKFARGRASAVLQKFGPMLCLGVTKDGSPRHPLYVKSDTSLVEYLIGKPETGGQVK